MKKTKKDTTAEPVRDAKIKLTVRSPDGGTFSLNGNFPNKVAFAIYMLACDWGDGKSHKVKSKVDVAYEAAARAFLDASEAFYNRIDKPRKKAS